MKQKLLLLLGCLALAGALAHAAPLGTAFTYQGRLADGGQPANGAYQMIFELRTDPSDGTLLGTNGVSVMMSNGLFTVGLDFGPLAFHGSALTGPASKISQIH